MSGDLVVPHDWSRKTLGELGRYLNGRAFRTQEWAKTGRPIIRIQDLTGSNRNPNYFQGEVAERYVVRPGDLLISWSATLGAYIWDGPEGVLNQHIFKVESAIDQRFHYHLVRERIGELQRSAHGSGMVHVTKDTFDNTPVAVPNDPNVQRLLADVIDRADVLRDSSAIHLARARRAIVRFRRAVLGAACSGLLTADWRQEHDDDAAPLVVDLLARTTTRRRPAPRPGSEWLPDEIPSTWAAAALDWLVDRIEAGKSVRAHGHKARPDEWGVIKVSAMSWGKFLADENKALLDSSPVNPDYEVRSGDLLISRANTVDLVGATVLVGDTRPQLLLSDKSLRLITMAGIDKTWLNYALRAPGVRAQFAQRATGTSDSMRNLSQDKILMTTLPLPPSDEQIEIARRLDLLMSAADQLSTRIGAAARRVDRSSQAVLAKVFRGELFGG